MRYRHIITTGFLLSACLVVGVGGSAYATPSSATAMSTTAQAQTQLSTTAADQALAAEFTQGLKFIVSVPDNVLREGDRATTVWLKANTPTQDENGQFFSKSSILGCTGAIAIAIAGVAFPVAKILKIKKLLGSVGGITKAVQLLWGASFNYEKVQAVGGAFAALGAELFGIVSIKEQCFS